MADSSLEPVKIGDNAAETGNKGTTVKDGPPRISKAQQKRDRANTKKEKQKAKRDANASREQVWTHDFDKNNGPFERYYKNQEVFIDEADWDAFITAMKNDLPTTFRVTGSRSSANDVNDIIRKVHIPNLIGIEYEGSPVDPPMSIPWYPGGLAWQLNVHKNVVRKVPEFKKLQSFLVYETEVGNISRQEAVSMLPPLVLDVEPHHKVLDMCAAPGSKTAQILEALHTFSSPDVSSTPTGIVVANDSDYKRAGLLVHQSSRLPSPSLLVTNVDASYYPNIRLDNEGNLLLFDRILCDVPCSGDGTMRKNPIIWRQWSIANGNGLHSLQVRILQRAMKMLAPGGRIVYSTCSLNPVENEAVVATALKNSNGEYHLVDVSDRLPELVRRPGISKWKVAVDKEANRMESSFETFWNGLTEHQRKETKIVESMFSPSSGVENLHLDRCWRIYPHLQNTGGFFVAVLERSPSFVPPPPKKKPAKRTVAEAEGTPEPSNKEADSERQVKRPRLDKDDGGEADLDVEMADAEVEEKAIVTEKPVEPEKKQGGGRYKEDPYTYVDPAHPNVKRCLESLRIRSSSFPTQNLFVRNSDATILRSIYLSNDIVKSILTSNEPSRLRIISAGIKVSARQEGAQRAAVKAKRARGEQVEEAETNVDDRENPKFRVLNDAVSHVLPYMNPEDVIVGDMDVLKVFVVHTYPLAREFKEPFGERFERCEFGHQVMKINPPPDNSSTGANALSHPLVFSIWKSNISLSLMIDKRAKSALSLRLFGEDLTGESKSAKDGGAEESKEAGALAQDAEADE